MLRTEKKPNPNGWLPVVALALQNGSRWLLHRRPPNKHHGGLWEFPGGKVEPGESPRVALVREILEEINVSVLERDLMPLSFADGRAEGEGRNITLLLFTASRWSGTLNANEGGEIGWFDSAAMLALNMLPLDRQLLERVADFAARETLLP